MNLAQTLFSKAHEAAISLADDLSVHDLDAKRMELFKSQGHDQEDYSQWLGHFNHARGSYRSQMSALSDGKAPSERKAEKAAAASAPTPTT
jgi:predicted metal-dependent hydrolase